MALPLVSQVSPIQDNSSKEKLQSCSSKLRSTLSIHSCYLGALFYKPGFSLHANVKRIVSPIIPGKCGQCLTREREIAMRILITITIPLLLFMSLFSAGFALGFTALGNALKTGSFTKLFNPEAPYKVASHRFSLFSLNTCFLPGGFSLDHGGVVPWKGRIDKVVNQIKQQNSDVICLQEVFDLESGYYLHKRIKDTYPESYINIGPKNIGLNSGLFVASKFPIKDAEFIPFDKDTLVGSGKNVKKGIFGFTLYQNSQPFARIYNLHLSHSEKDDRPTNEEILGRKKQIDALLTKLYRDAAKYGNIPMIITGDFNMDTWEYMQSPIAQHSYNDYLAKTQGKPGTCHTDFLKDCIWVPDRVNHFQDFTLDHTILFNKLLTNNGYIPLQTGFYPTTQKVDSVCYANPYAASTDHDGLLTEFIRV